MWDMEVSNDQDEDHGGKRGCRSSEAVTRLLARYLILFSPGGVPGKLEASAQDVRLPGMAHSLSPECTPLKHEYDSCFNAWFEGYLEPAVASASSAEARAAYSKQKAEEFEQKCGKIWNSYRDCVQVRYKISFLANCIVNVRFRKQSKKKALIRCYNKQGTKIL